MSKKILSVSEQYPAVLSMPIFSKTVQLRDAEWFSSLAALLPQHMTKAICNDNGLTLQGGFCLIEGIASSSLANSIKSIEFLELLFWY